VDDIDILKELQAWETFYNLCKRPLFSVSLQLENFGRFWLAGYPLPAALQN
jgi:hypothetical protein